jgi:hypothetical protein
MNYLELQQIFLDKYSLGASYCRTLYDKGGVCIFVQKNLRHVSIHLVKYCKDKDFEACAIKIYLNTRKVCIITIYRAPSGSFDAFITKLYAILKKLFTVTVALIICGDLNINYLVDSNRKNQIEALFKTYNLTSVVNFPTRIQHNSTSSINNIFIDVIKCGNYSVRPVINRLSDHDAQTITLHSLRLRPPSKKFVWVRNINEQTINDFLLKLSYETWDAVFSTDNVNTMHNSFLDSYLKIFYSSFPLKKVSVGKNNNNNWITLGILTSCKCKRELFIACRDSNNLDLLNYYK